MEYKFINLLMGASLLALAKSIYYPILPFTIVPCTFLLTPFLEIAVYLCKVCTVHPLVGGLRKDFILRCNAYVICPYEKK